MRMSKFYLVVLVAATSLPLFADNEGGLLLEADLKKEISKQFSVSFGGDLRTRNNFKTMDRWSLAVGADYKFNKWLKVDAGYKFMRTNYREDINYKTSGAYNKWRPSYWGNKHRFYASVTGDYKFANNIKLSLRERWQYTYRPSATVQRWDFDNEQWEDKYRSSKGKNQLRSRFQIEYARKRALFTPYANVELYNSWGLEKVRYTVGSDIRLNRQHSLDVFYRYQHISNVSDDEYDPNMHYLGIGYKFKF